MSISRPASPFSIVVALGLVAVVLSSAGGASAQPGVSVAELRLELAEPELGATLDDAAASTEAQDALRAPTAGDYALPVIGIVGGSLLTLGGAVCLLGSSFVYALQTHSGHGDLDTTRGVMMASGIGLGLGLSFLVSGSVSVSSLRHRAREAELRDVRVAVAPLDGGAMGAVGGRY